GSGRRAVGAIRTPGSCGVRVVTRGRRGIKYGASVWSGRRRGGRYVGRFDRRRRVVFAPWRRFSQAFPWRTEPQRSLVEEHITTVAPSTTMPAGIAAGWMTFARGPEPGASGGVYATGAVEPSRQAGTICPAAEK